MTALTCSRSSPSNHSIMSWRLAPASIFSKMTEAGMRVPLSTQAPLTFPGMLSTAGHCDQSSAATEGFSFRSFYTVSWVSGECGGRTVPAPRAVRRIREWKARKLRRSRWSAQSRRRRIAPVPDPCAQTERSRKIICDHHARGDQNPRKKQEHAHPVESSERQIVRSQKDHQGRKKPVQVVETYGHKKQHRKRQHKRNLHPEVIERILSAQGRAAAGQTQHQLRDRKDEKSPDDDGQNRRFWSDPRAQRRRHQPN